MTIQTTGVVLPMDNIDTDQIVPARFLKLTSKKGYGKFLFYDWRYTPESKVIETFPLNQAKHATSKVLIAGNNFGCGSSREHAAWAIADYGFKVIISTQIADIHKENLYNNGVLPIELSKDDVQQLMTMVTKKPGARIEVDIASQCIQAEDIGLYRTFEISPFKKECLLSGVDTTQYLINLRPLITEFENTRDNKKNQV